MNPTVITILRWTARIPGTLMSLLFVFLVVGEAISPPPNHPNEPMTVNTMVQLSLTFVGILGLVLAWRWEIAGSVLALAAFVALGVVNPRTVPWPLLAFASPAAILIFTGLMTRLGTPPRAHPTMPGT